MNTVTNNISELFGDVVYTYTRQQAIDDGCLVDISETAAEAGFAIPVALSRATWEDCVEWNEDDTKRQTYQDLSGRLWDVVYMAFIAACANRNSSTMFYQLYRVPRGGRGKKARKVTLKLIIGPGDQGEPVITIMEPNED